MLEAESGPGIHNEGNDVHGIPEIELPLLKIKNMLGLDCPKNGSHAVSTSIVPLVFAGWFP